MDVGDSSVNLEILLFGAGKGHCNMMVFLYSANMGNAKHCQPWKWDLIWNHNTQGFFFFHFRFFLFNHICYKYSIETQFFRTEMVFKEASHVWLFSQAFSCFTNCQAVRVPFPKKYSLWLCWGLWKATHSLETWGIIYTSQFNRHQCMKHVDVL